MASLQFLHFVLVWLGAIWNDIFSISNGPDNCLRLRWLNHVCMLDLVAGSAGSAGTNGTHPCYVVQTDGLKFLNLFLRLWGC